MSESHYLRALLIASAAVFSTQTFAADLPSHRAPPVYIPPPAVMTWTGAYIGLNAGYMFGGRRGTTTTTDPIFAAPTWATELALSEALATGTAGGQTKGFIGGGQIGYNYQFNPSAVAGIEADIQGTTARGSGAFSGQGIPVGFPNETITSTVSASKRISYFGTLRGRIGILATPSLLLYGTGGLAYGGVSSHTTIAQDNLPFANGVFGSTGGSSRTKVGYAVGGGAEYMISSNFSAKIEYLYYDLGHVSYTMPDLQYSTLYASTPHASAHFNGNIVRVGLNYHFNDVAAPVVARY